MSRYVETADDVNVEGVEFYVPAEADGYIYYDAECTEKVPAEKLIHAFDMNDIVIVDNGVYCRATNLSIDGRVANINYVIVDDDTLTPKTVMSYDMFLDVDTEIAADFDLLGKVISDLQSDIEISMGAISGTLKHVTEYTGFSGDPAEQSGNYLALHITNNFDKPIVVELIGGFHGPVTLDADGIIILRIANKEQQVKVTSGDLVQIYSLSDLELLSE